MFTEYFKFSGPPFQLSPDHRFFFGSNTHQKALAYLNFGLLQGEGFIIVTGDVGAGKTTLVGHLLAQLDSSKYVAAKVVTTQLEADDTLRMVASAFGIQQEGVDKASLLRRFERFLIDNQSRGKRVLLLIDEAQNLPWRSLEELRMLSNFQVDEKAALQFYLLGQPQFRQTLAHEQLEQLRQRVIASHHLAPMERDETRGYIEHRLTQVGWKNDPAFANEAFDRIYEHTGGVPRKINTLCTRILLFAALEERHAIDTDTVNEVIKDLMQEGGQGMPPAAAAGPLPGVVRESANGARVDLGRIEQRLDSLERAVTQNEKALRRALQMFAAYLDTGDKLDPPQASGRHS
ncbi:MAG TPA: XrtA/PEP-CTERM system-associated ATPase [Alphaproteobacteria bacterium]|nr:XrtA/PEP-CTERM system-associated ATPase [Alphaproteobacteria bacterium]